MSVEKWLYSFSNLNLEIFKFDDPTALISSMKAMCSLMHNSQAYSKNEMYLYEQLYVFILCYILLPRDSILNFNLWASKYNTVFALSHSLVYHTAVYIYLYDWRISTIPPYKYL